MNQGIKSSLRPNGRSDVLRPGRRAWWYRNGPSVAVLAIAAAFALAAWWATLKYVRLRAQPEFDVEVQRLHALISQKMQDNEDALRGDVVGQLAAIGRFDAAYNQAVYQGAQEVGKKFPNREHIDLFVRYPRPKPERGNSVGDDKPIDCRIGHNLERSLRE